MGRPAFRMRSRSSASGAERTPSATSASTLRSNTGEPDRPGAAGPEPVTQGFLGEPRRRRLLPRYHTVLLLDQRTQRVMFLARHRGMLSPGADISYNRTSSVMTARR